MNPQSQRIDVPTSRGARGGSEIDGPWFSDTAETAEAPLLVWGGTGPDRERAARSLHDHSRERNGPFIAVRCGALPADLLESELFGYDRGAFAGAHCQKPGKIDAALGGTLFLDEIENLPHPLQARLLVVLKSVRGARRAARVDVRVMAGANEDPRSLVLRGCLHDGLYRRLSGLGLRIAPCHDPAGPPAPLPADPVTALGTPPAPAAPGVPRPRSREDSGLKAIARRAALDAERAVLKAVLEQVRWNRLEASRRLKVSYKTLRWKIRQCGLDG